MLGQSNFAANQNRRLNQSPVDALIDLEFRCWLCCIIPIWLNLDTLTRLRITAIAVTAERSGELGASTPK